MSCNERCPLAKKAQCPARGWSERLLIGIFSTLLIWSQMVANVANIPDLRRFWRAKFRSQIFASICEHIYEHEPHPKSTGKYRYLRPRRSQIFAELHPDFSFDCFHIAIASPHRASFLHSSLHRRPLRLVVILEYACLGARIGRARCGDRALLGAYLRPRKYIL